MADLLVAVCPSCSQKYKVPRENVGKRARCKKCGQTFKILEEPPIDDETIFGWVTEDDPASSSVLGSTGIFGHGFNEATQVPHGNRWTHPAPPSSPRVTFVDLTDKGAVFTFESVLLRNRDFRCSFPHRCVQCLTREDLELHYIVWGDQLHKHDAAMVSEAELRAHRPLEKMMAEHGLRWFDLLEPVEMMPMPFNQPFPYCVCQHCSAPNAVKARLVGKDEDDLCRLTVLNPAIALDFYRNNGGRNTPEYKRLLVACRQRRDNEWNSLSPGVRIKVAQWYTPRGDEKFLGYYADKDFAKTERGLAGVVLTDKRIVYRKYAAQREYRLDREGMIDIEATHSSASVEISQEDRRDAILATTPLAASSLARTLTSLSKPWQINISTRP